MRFLSLFGSVFLFASLPVAMWFTLRAQMLWLYYDPLEIAACVLWVVLILGWAIRCSSKRAQDKTLTWSDSVLPLCLVLTLVCWAFDLPLRMVFWTHYSALESATKDSTLERDSKTSKRLGAFTPLQIVQSGKATRILLWKDDNWYSVVAIGFAHCPGDASCKNANFPQYHYFNDDPPVLKPMGSDWYAIQVDGEDKDEDAP
ncbi:hypothetical protein IAD21_03560 [Abditibacteriota bacterium]|nr:hypothetical protein IAD21_03560 [Abditibacteriota bacterium]